MSRRMSWPYPPELELAVREAAELTGIPLSRIKALVDERIIATDHLTQPPVYPIVKEIVLGHLAQSLEEEVMP